jgi:hypothetical protein
VASLFAVKPIPFKELGAIATQSITKGELVIEEAPLFRLSVRRRLSLVEQLATGADADVHAYPPALPAPSDAPLAAFLFSRQVDVDPSVEEQAKGYSALDVAIGSVASRRQRSDSLRAR